MFSDRHVDEPKLQNIYYLLLIFTCDSEEKSFRITRKYNIGHFSFIQFGESGSEYMSFESRHELLELEKAWYHANYKAVKDIGVRRYQKIHGHAIHHYACRKHIFIF